MALTLNAEQKSIYDIFSGENQYIIPPYQRAYSWTNVQCKALLEDIKKAFYSEEQEGYFLGNIVLAKSREEKNKLEVIDGQQRLTTLILLIKVLLSFDKENKALYNSIWIKDRRTDEEIQRLETNVFMEQDYNYFREVLDLDFSSNICESLSEEENLFKKNICYFYNKFQEFSKSNDILKISDFLLDNIYILPIEIEDIDADKARKNALQVFETINNRGLNLSTSDIFKARLYSMALNELEHEKFILQWKDLSIKCDEIYFKIDDVFEIYSYIVRNENNLEYNFTYSFANQAQEFFLENKYSPFLSKKYNEIMNNLLEICNFTIFFINVLKNSNNVRSEELLKWFQLVHQGLNIGSPKLISKYDFYIMFYKCSRENKDDLVFKSKKLISKIDLNKIEKDKNNPFTVGLNAYFKKLHSGNLNAFFLLLGLFLDNENMALKPYSFIDNNLLFNNNSFNIEKNKFIENLIKLNSKLKKEKQQKMLIRQAHRFIRGFNEN